MPQKNRSRNRSRITIEPGPTTPGGPGIIDPTDPDAQRRFQIQQRGGLYSDRARIDPWKRGFPHKRITRVAGRPGRRAGRRRT